MTRSRATAKDAGTRTETAVVTYLREAVGDDRIERRRMSGSKDRGDVTGLRSAHGHRVVVEVKDCSRIEVTPWLREAEVERLNDSAEVCCVVAKRRGTAAPGDQLVMLTLRDFAALISGRRHDEQ